METEKTQNFAKADVPVQQLALSWGDTGGTGVELPTSKRAGGPVDAWAHVSAGIKRQIGIDYIMLVRQMSCVIGHCVSMLPLLGPDPI